MLSRLVVRVRMLGKILQFDVGVGKGYLSSVTTGARSDRNWSARRRALEEEEEVT